MKRFKEFINEGITNYLQPKSEVEIKKALKDVIYAPDVLKIIENYIEKYPDNFYFFIEFIERYKQRYLLDADVYDFFEAPWQEENTENKENKNDEAIEDNPDHLRNVIESNLDDWATGGDLLPEDMTIVQNLIKDLNKTSWYKADYLGFERPVIETSIRENAMGFLKPKTEEDIEKALNKLDIFDRIIEIKKHNISKKYMPSKEEIKKFLDNWGDDVHSTDLKIRNIISLELPFDLLPIRTEPSSTKTIYSNNKNKIIYSNYLDLNGEELSKLPDNLVVYGNLTITNNKFKKLPKGLEVFGYLQCDFNDLTELPNDMIIHSSINCSHNLLKSLHNNMTIQGELDCSHNSLNELPKGLKVKGILDCSNNNLVELPEDIEIDGRIYSHHNKYGIDLTGIGSLYKTSRKSQFYIENVNEGNAMSFLKPKTPEEIDNQLDDFFKEFPVRVEYVVRRYMKDYKDFDAFFLTFLNEFPDSKNYDDFIKNEINDFINIQIDDGEMKYSDIENKSNEEIIEEYYPEDIKIETICSILNSPIIKFSIFNDFIDDLKKIDW